MKIYKFLGLVLIILFYTTSVDAQNRGFTNSSYGSGISEDVVIQTDPETGSLIVITDEETNKYIGEIIKKLDKPIPQVLIKVVFLEVTHTDGLDLGLEGMFEHQDSDTDVIETIFGLASETQGGFYRVLEKDFSLTLRALANVGKLEVLSKPSILTRHNQEAVITVGQEVPFIRNSRVTQDGQIINTVEYEDIGIILRVTPFITADGQVEMELSPEISTLTGDTVPISDTVNAAVFAKRSAETRVVVPDGKTVVIGGLMEDNKTESVRKIPLLGDIPVLGMAFRRTINSNSKTELLIFLTPHIVAGADQLQALSSAEKNKTELIPEVIPSSMMDKYIENLE